MTLPVPKEALIELARNAGAAILEIYNTEFNVTDKADKTPLTEADLAAHNIIVSTLEKLTPEIPVLSEESCQIPYETRQAWQRYWLIDPLDGTKEFIKRNGEFTVNIALIEDQQPTLGVIYAPVIDKLYYGVVGDGAWMSEAGADLQPISVVKQRRNPARVAGSRSHAGESLQKFLANLGEYELVSMGSSLKSCLVAEGKADLYPRLGLTSEWDTGAAQAIVEAAGGKLTELDMQPLRYNTKESLLNPYFFVFGDSTVDWSRYLAED
ncbi:MAG: 3'(2'),5'-bisphosphate nucleotidase CysQ [Gammaproteobacteria bacterium]|nr:3'(2'),5'-bisphosphate nucleotidase CysQ [Gammaproteobacteria bacterium]